MCQELYVCLLTTLIPLWIKQKKPSLTPLTHPEYLLCIYGQIILPYNFTDWLKIGKIFRCFNDLILSQSFVIGKRKLFLLSRLVKFTNFVFWKIYFTPAKTNTVLCFIYIFWRNCADEMQSAVHPQSGGGLDCKEMYLSHTSHIALSLLRFRQHCLVSLLSKHMAQEKTWNVSLETWWLEILPF